MSKVTTGILKRKFLFAILAAITVFGAVYGFAASLGVSTTKLSAGNAAIASCQASSTSAAYAVAYDTTVKGYGVSSVTVSGLGAGCNNLPIDVTLSDASNASLGEITGNTGAGTSVTLNTPAGTHIDASKVNNLSVAING